MSPQWHCGFSSLCDVLYHTCSGSSWAGVLQTVPGLTFPADLYLEGSDQHRGGRGGGEGRAGHLSVAMTLSCTGGLSTQVVWISGDDDDV
jgi:hypothetical protein